MRFCTSMKTTCTITVQAPTSNHSPSKQETPYQIYKPDKRRTGTSKSHTVASRRGGRVDIKSTETFGITARKVSLLQFPHTSNINIRLLIETSRRWYNR